MVGYQAVLLCLTVTHVLWQREDQAIAAVRKGLSVLEAYLQTRTYLTGHRVTLADVIVSSNVYNGYTRVSAAILAAAIFTQFPADHSLQLTTVCHSLQGLSGRLRHARISPAHQHLDLLVDL